MKLIYSSSVSGLFKAYLSSLNIIVGKTSKSNVSSLHMGANDRSLAMSVLRPGY